MKYSWLKFIKSVPVTEENDFEELTFKEPINIPDKILNAILILDFPETDEEEQKGFDIINQWYDELKEQGFTAIEMTAIPDGISIMGTKQPIIKK